MKRLFPLLLLTCLVFAQFDEGSSDGSFSNENPLLAQAYLEDDRNGDLSDEDLPAEQTQYESVPQTIPSDDSFLDDLIDDQPLLTQPPPESEPAPPAPETPDVQSIPSQPSIAEPPVEPTSQPSAIKQPVDNGVKYSTTPKLNVAVVQETPDIPQFSHEKHLEEVGAECVQCHQTLFTESVRGYRSGPSMKEICSQCHNGSDAPAEVLAGFSNEKKYVKTYMPLFSHTTHLEHTDDCKSCHKDIYGEIKKIKIPPPMAICSGCHNNNKANANCRVCHEDPSRLKPKTHSPRWTYRYGHGMYARYNQAQCRDCHVDRECSQCHRGMGTFSVHRAGYKYSHGMDVRQRQVNCGFCHDLENSCARCHVRTR